MKNQDVKVCVGLMVIAIAAWVVSFYFPETSIWAGGNDDRPYQASAGTWPRIVAVVLFILCGLQILVDTVLPAALTQKDPYECEFDCAPEEEQPEITPESRARALRFFAVFLGYLLLLNPLGFPIATVLFGAGCIFAMDMGKMSRLHGLMWSTGISIIIVVLFCRILYLPLPRGMGIFRELSQFIIF